MIVIQAFLIGCILTSSLNIVIYQYANPNKNEKSEVRKQLPEGNLRDEFKEDR